MADESSIGGGDIPESDFGGSGAGAGGISIGSLYGEVSLRHDGLERDASSVKATVADVARQLEELGAVQVASGLTAQFQQITAAMTPVAAMASALAGALGGLTDGGVSNISRGGGVSQAAAALARAQAAAIKSPGAVRLPRSGAGSAAGLTVAQKNALEVERAQYGGNAAGRLRVERDRSLGEMHDRGADASQIAQTSAEYDARIAQASARERSAAQRGQEAAERHTASGAARTANIDARLEDGIASAAERSGDAGAALQARLARAQYENAAASARISGMPSGAARTQAGALAASALGAQQRAAGADFAKAADAQGLQEMGASLDRLRAKRDLFLSGWQASGEDVRRFLSDLGALYKQVDAAATATPAQDAGQARLLEEIGSSARGATGSSQAGGLPGALHGAPDAVGGAFGSAVEQSLWQSQEGTRGAAGYRQRRKPVSFGTAMRRDLNSGLRREVDTGVGQLAQRGVSGLVGGALKGVSGLFSRPGQNQGAGGLGSGAKADGSAGKPFYTLPAPSGAAAAGGAKGAATGAAGAAGLSGLTSLASPALMLPQLLGSKAGAGALANALGGLLHFASGGPVPDQGKGGGDTVPAMLSPGEFVLSRPMLAQMAGANRSFGPNAGAGAGMGRGGSVTVTIHQHGDNHFHSDADLEEFSRRQAWSVKNQLQTSAPGMF